MQLKSLLVPALLVSFAGAAASVARVGEPDPKQHTKRTLAANPDAKWDSEVILVRFKQGAPDASKELVRSLVGGHAINTFWLVPGLEELQVTGDVLDAMDTANLFPAVVEYAELDYIVHTWNQPNDPSFGQLWGLNNTGQTVNGDPGIAGADINAPEAWDTFTGDPNFVIASIDTGVNYNHPDLSANSWTNPGEIPGNGIDDDHNGYVDDVRGWDFFNNDNNPIDDNGHGTHTSGTIGARGNNGVGVVGVNWQCKIMALKFLGSGGSGSTTGALNALQYAVAKGVKVSNNSWGGGGFSQSMLNAINNSQNVGHLFVAAAGNAGSNNDSSPSYPASYTSPNIIAVAATNNNDQLASFSNYGANSVDVGAPGVTIYSTYGSGYAYLDGTSMATPHVAGLAALIYGQNPSWTWQQVKNQIMTTTRPIPALSGRCVSGGVINAQAAIGPAAPPTPPTAPTSVDAIENGVGNARYTWTDNSSNETSFQLNRQRKVSGVWGSDTAFTALANAVSFQQAPGAGVWRYEVRASNSAGPSAYSTYVVVQPQGPTGINVADVTDLTVTLSWIDTSSFEEGFRVQREEFVNGVWTNTTNLPTTSSNITFKVDTVPESGTYRYRVQSFAETRTSAFTSWLEVAF